MKKTSSILKIIIILVISILPPYFNNSLFAQLSGTKNIPGNYATIRDAINDINAVGVNGPVVFLLANGAHAISCTGIDITTSAWIGRTATPWGISGTSTTNTVTFKPAAGATVVITITMSATGQSGIILHGADYIIFDGSNNGTSSRDMTIQVAANAYAGGNVFDIKDVGNSGSAIDGGSNNNIIKNCIIIGPNNTGTSQRGIYMRNSGGTNPDENNSNLIENNEIYKAYYGIWNSGIGTAVEHTGNIIRNNKVGHTADYVTNKGIYVINNTNLEISGNEVFNIYNSLAGTYVTGIEVANSTSVTISKNKIHDIGNTFSGASAGGKGIFLNPSVASPNITVTNNFIYGIVGGSDAVTTPSYIPSGICLTYTTTATTGGVSICFNSIYLTPNASYGLRAANAVAAGVCIYGTLAMTGITMCSNIFRTSLGEAAATTSYGYAVCYAGAFASPFATINYNIYYVNGQDNNYVGYGNSASRNAITDWRTYTGQDVNSTFAVDPTFVSTTNLHVTSFVSGANCASITTDIDGQTRPATPSIGADEDVVTPIELLSFTASCNDNNIVLNWSTASEINNNYFTIERSTEQNLQDLKWEVIATIKGAGNSNQIINYNYTDFPNIALQNIYYRLKQTDYDGSFKYYDIITTSCSKECSFSLNKIYPNPSTDLVYISYSTNEDQIIKLSVFDLLGHEIISENLISNKGENINQINLNNLQNGLYWIVINSKDMVHSYKINLIN